jgi:hypothetical protein
LKLRLNLCLGLGLNFYLGLGLNLYLRLGLNLYLRLGLNLCLRLGLNLCLRLGLNLCLRLRLNLYLSKLVLFVIGSLLGRFLCTIYQRIDIFDIECFQLFSEQFFVVKHIIVGILIKISVNERYGGISLEHYVCNLL